MGFAPLRRARLNQPNGDGIDWSNPLTKGLVFAVIGGIASNIVGQTKGSLIGSALRGVGLPGTTFDTVNNSASRVDFLNSVPAVGGERSFFSLMMHTGIDINTFQYLINRDTVSNLLAIRYFSAGNYRAQITWAGLGLIVSAEQISANVWHSLTASTPKSNSTANADAALWLDGKKLTIASDVAPIDGAVSSSGTSDVILSGRIADNIRTLGGSQALSLSWNRVLTDKEHAALHANPWQVFL